jgi:hypothetical protein
MKTQGMWTASLGLMAWVAISCGPIDSTSHPEQTLATINTLRQEAALTGPLHSGLSSCEYDTDSPQLCTQANNDPGTPCLPLSDQGLAYECTGSGNNAWAPLIVKAQDVCEGPLPAHAYNTGDDDMDGVPGCDCNLYPCGGEGAPPPGVTCDTDDFGPGPTTEAEGLYYVQYLAWDASYNIQSAILSVMVRDTLPPRIELMGSPVIQTECFLPLSDAPEDPAPYVDPGATAQDLCYGDLSQDILSLGGPIKSLPGSYSTEYTVKDAAGNWADPITRTVEVVDTLAPTLTASAPMQIWPPNGSMHVFSLSQCAQARDRCEGHMNLNARGTIDSITSNEPGDDADDIIITSNGTFALRAERRPQGTGRVYTVAFSVADNSGNVTQGQCTVDVPLHASPPHP